MSEFCWEIAAWYPAGPTICRANERIFDNTPANPARVTCQLALDDAAAAAALGTKTDMNADMTPPRARWLRF
jgi:hypothetical protein